MSTSHHTESGADTFVLSQAFVGFSWPRVSELTSGTPLGVFGTLMVSPQSFPPHSVIKSYTHPASLQYC